MAELLHILIISTVTAMMMLSSVVSGQADLTCPIPNGYSCIIACNDDDDCEGNELCCGTGCGGRLCTEPVDCPEATCPNVSCSVAGIPAGECCTVCGCVDPHGQFVKTGDTYKDDCNTCTCDGDNSTSCTEMACNLTCPTPTAGPCIITCNDDDDCEGNELCCYNGCGRVCTVPVECAGGTCPNVTCSVAGIPAGECCTVCGCNTPNGGFVEVGDTYKDDCNNCTCNGDGTVSCTEMVCAGQTCPFPNGFSCAIDCNDDDDCEGNELCCSTGCGGRLCTEPVDCPEVTCPRVDCSVSGIPAGECCATCGCVDPHGQFVKIGDTYKDDCNTCTCDGDGTASCTEIGCDLTCPTPMVGPCIIDCNDDDDCEGNELCCYNGCGRVCTVPVECAGMTCPNVNCSVAGIPAGECCTICGCNTPNGEFVKVGDTYKDDCNNCTCDGDGTASCTEMACGGGTTMVAIGYIWLAAICVFISYLQYE